jgi:monosaccharide-transporting ATPase
MADAPLLQLRAIDKHYPGVHALARVDFEVHAGEIHALLGQNGAGKSTLIKVLTGVTRPDAGTMRLAGKEIRPRSPAHAQRLGISTVYQEVNLVPTLSVAENLSLGRPPRRWWGISWRRIRRQARQALAALGLSIDPTEALGVYPVAIQQLVAIARAVSFDARLLILDEPTSSLDKQESERLFDTMRKLRERGLGIIFVTHFLEQVYRVCDRITVLRGGRRVGTWKAAELPQRQLVMEMLGGAAQDQPPAVAPIVGPERAVLLRARGLSRSGAIEPFDLDLRAGEVLGLAGLLGSGRTEIARLLFGADRADSGTIAVGRDGPRAMRPREAIALGIALCPEERKTDGVFGEMSVRDNIMLVLQRRLSRLGIVSRRVHTLVAKDWVWRLGIATPDIDRPVKFLSGGNQQKVILARWLACEPRILLLDEPTRGVDIGSKGEIERLIAGLAEQGLAILFISAELDEVVRRSQRVLVLRERRVVGELSGGEISERAILDRIAGGA